MSVEMPGCGKCPIKVGDRLCQTEDGKSPAFCPTENYPEIVQRVLEEFKKPEILEFAKQASIQEGQGYTDKELGYAQTKPVKPRLVEIIEFAKKMKYKKLGLVFCMGLRSEAKVVEKILTTNKFELVSAVCKYGREPKETIDVQDDQKIKVGSFESMCNPIYQAKLLNHEKSEFNILLGLCVGHDSLFFRYAEAPTTVLAVKDRVTNEAPSGAKRQTPAAIVAAHRPDA